MARCQFGLKNLTSTVIVRLYKFIQTQSDDQELDEMWAWTLWNCDLPIPENVRNKVELVCKATDRAYNTQVLSFKI